jgi:HPt (histidine-containing phosphotransfer) domain-containing protein
MQSEQSIDMKTFNELKDLMGADFIGELIDTYLLETGKLIEQLQEAFSIKDAVVFGRLAHSIKSSSASLGALIFSQQARELEIMGKGEDLTDAESKVEKLSADFSQIRNRLEELRDGA